MKTFNLLVIIAALSACQSAETVGRTSTMSPGTQTMESIYARTPCDDLGIDQAAHRERQAIHSEFRPEGDTISDETWKGYIEHYKKLGSFYTRYDRLMAKAIAQCPASTLPPRDDVMPGGDGVQGGSREQRRTANLVWLNMNKRALASSEDFLKSEQEFRRSEQRRKTEEVGNVLMGAIVGAGILAGAYNSAQASTPRSTSGGSSGTQCRPYDGTCSRNDPNYAQCMALPRCAP